MNTFPTNLLGPLALFPVVIGILVAFWSVFWHAFALWKAAQNGQKGWYILLYLINFLGILQILYLAFFQKKVKKS